MDQSCKNISILNSQIHDVGYNGVAINGGVDNTTDMLISENNLIQNNQIYNLGQLVGHGAGVHIEQSAYNIVTHNEIHDGPRHGVNIEGSYDNLPDINLAAHNLISYNNAYNLSNDSSDSGNYYQFAGGRSNQYDHNMSHESHAGFTNAAYYLDASTTSATVSNNIGFNPPCLLDNSVNQATCVASTNSTDKPGNSFTNNISSADPAVWAAAGLDSNQMGRLPTGTPVASVRRILPAVLPLLLNHSATHP
jgi:hypothetical protein